MEFLEIEDIILFHRKIVSKTDGSDGIRDIGLGLGIAEGTINENNILEWIERHK